MNVIDLTHTINENMPVYPGTEKPKLKTANTYEKDGFKETLITMFSHTGTHIDPPAHVLPSKTTLDSFEVSRFVGKALVIDCRMLKDGEEIALDHIKSSCEKVMEAEYLLFNLGWDKKWGTDEYFGKYPCLSEEALDFIINGNYKELALMQ